MSADKLKEAHVKLRAALHEVMDTWHMLDGASADTLLAAGEAAGIISKAKGLLGRDIDQAARH